MGDLRIEDLVVEYSGGGEAVHVIDGLNMEVSAGSLVVVLGPSGCGKTSLLSCIGGILSPTGGRIRVGDIDVTALDRRGLAAYRRDTVGFVFQSFNLMASLTARENVMVPLWAAGWSLSAARERADELLARVGLQDRMTHRPGNLSGGQQQRVAVARAIASDPPLILADEPTAHLDHGQLEGVLELLRELAGGERTVVVAAHDTRILPFADRVINLVPDFPKAASAGVTGIADRHHAGHAEDPVKSVHEMPDFAPLTTPTLIGLLQQRAVQHQDKVAFSFSRDGEEKQVSRLTYQQLDAKARGIASSLQQQGAAGQRVLVLCHPGLDFIAGLFGCLYAGAVAVPLHPPAHKQLVPRVASILADAQADFVLTTTGVQAKIAGTVDGLLDERSVRRCFIDSVDSDGSEDEDWVAPEIDPSAPAIVQYTSGSTGSPKGVVLTHANLVHNLEAIRQAFHPQSWQPGGVVGVFWLPPHHDMGLIGGILETLYVGSTSVLMPPSAFIKRPMRWLEAMSRHRATITAAPNFAYDMCVALSSPAERAALDLSCWRTALCGAERVRPKTVQEFSNAFAPADFRPEAFHPVYGLAEATLLVSGQPDFTAPVVRHLDSVALREHRVVEVAPEHPSAAALVGCGEPQGGQEVIVVDQVTRRQCGADEVGELWISGPSVAQGYWQQPEQTEEAFSAHLAETGRGPFLRTGDLGFFRSGELFVTERCKDLIIIRGSNHYPGDIETTAQDCHPALLPGRGAAFSVTPGRDAAEQLVVVQEVNHHQINAAELAEIVHAIRTAITEHHGIGPHAVVLVEALRIPVTSSGKIQRSRCRQQFLDGELEALADWHAPPPPDAHPAVAAGSEHDRRSAAEIADWITIQLSGELGVPASEIDPSRPFAYYGLDSIHAVRLTAALEAWLGLALSPTLAYEYPTIDLLSGHLAEDAPVNACTTTPVGDGGDARARAEDEPIAIIGIGSRFPGADGPAAFWRLLSDGVDAITEVPPDRWDVDAFYDSDPCVPGTAVSRRGGFVPGVDEFDYQFFGISPRESAQMDPQQRLLMEVAWEALEDAGQVPERLAGSPTGVFVGISTNDYGHLQVGRLELVDAYTGTGNALSIAANRLSYFHDFRGPSMAIDTACSSSLVAVHQACRSLRDGECTLAVAGGVNVILSPALMINFTKARLMAPDGRCKTFDADADGYVRGEGAGIVVLKPLGQALADNDPIYALIRGTAINQDGLTNGLIAPSRQAQEAVLAEAYRRAGLSPGTVQYVEAHGTGTLLGDAIEAKALGTILADGRPPGSRCLIGSAKTNIGHLEAAAGVAGLIKVALALRHRAVPPSLNFAKPNPNIPFDSLPLRVAATLTPLPVNGARAVAGVSSFGFGGTNAHAVLTEAPQVRVAPEQGAAADRAELLPLSARSPAALAALARRYESALATPVPLADLCYTAGARRGHHDHRLCVTGDSGAEMSESLAAYRRGESRSGLSFGRSRRSHRPAVIFVFSGQGSQWSGMGRRLAVEEPVFRDALARCDRAMSPYLERSVLTELTAEQLDDIAVVQPAIFAVQVALATLWRSWGVEPAAIVGHSLGEAAAAHIAGALSLEDAARVVCARAQLLRRVRGHGAMVAAEVSLAEAQELIAGEESRVAIAASNSHRSTVLSGDRAVLADLVAVLEQRDRFCRWIEVDVASHSPQMDALGADLKDAIAGLQSAAPSIPIYSTVTGDLLAARPLDAGYWVEHLCSPVRFSPTLRRLLDAGHDAVVEISPHPILLSAVREDAEDLGRSCTLLPSMRRDDEGRATALGSLGALYSLGQPVEWEQLYPSDGRRVVATPSYPWQRVRSWLDVGTTTASAPGTFADRPQPNPGGSADLLEKIYQLRWQPASIQLDRDGASRPAEAGSWIIFSDGGITADTLRDHLESHSQTCVLVEPGLDQDFELLTPGSYRLDPSQPEHFRRLFEEAFGDDRPPCRAVVHLWDLLAAPPADTSTGSLESAAALGPVSVLHLVQALALAGWSEPPRLWLVTRGAQVTDASENTTATTTVTTTATTAEPVSIAQAPVWGMGRTIDHEYPELRCTRVDLSASGRPEELPALFQEVWADNREVDVALRGSRRYVARLTRYDEAEHAETPGGFDGFKADATYLITGGLGALGCAVAVWMAEQGAKHLVLMGRGAASPSAQETLAALREAGTEVMVARGDVTRSDQVTEVLESASASMPPLRGVVHAAGVLDDGILQRLNERQLLEALAPKVQGAWNLHALTQDAALDFFVLFSSAASLLGSPGAANYAAANAFLDALAWHRRAEGRAALSINWGPWAGLGFSARSQQRGQFAQHGVEDMPAAECLRALSYLLPRSAPQVAVLDIDWTRSYSGSHPSTNPPLLADLQRDLPDGEQQTPSDLYSTLQGAAPDKRQRLLESYLRDLTAGKLGLAPSSLDIESPLSYLGVDSLITLELRIQLERDLGITVPVAQLLDGPSVASLSGWLVDQLPVMAPGTPATQPGGTLPPKTAPEETAPQDKGNAAASRGIDLLTRVPELSDDAVERLLAKVIAERALSADGDKRGDDDG